MRIIARTFHCCASINFKRRDKINCEKKKKKKTTTTRNYNKKFVAIILQLIRWRNKIEFQLLVNVLNERVRVCMYNWLIHRNTPSTHTYSYSFIITSFVVVFVFEFLLVHESKIVNTNEFFESGKEHIQQVRSYIHQIPEYFVINSKSFNEEIRIQFNESENKTFGISIWLHAKMTHNFQSMFFFLIFCMWFIGCRHSIVIVQIKNVSLFPRLNWKIFGVLNYILNSKIF